MLTASRGELLARLSPGEAGIRTLKASFSAELRRADGGAARVVSGMVAMERPGKLRMRGSAAMLPTLFDLLDDGTTVSVHVPRDRAVYRGPRSSAARGGLPDAGLLTGVFLGLCEEPGLIHAVEAEPTRYRLYSIDAAAALLSRRVTFDRANLSPVRYEYFDREGRVAREVRCVGFAPTEGAPGLLPREISLRDAGGARLSVRFSGLSANATLPSGMFAMEAPPGTAVRPLAECAP